MAGLEKTGENDCRIVLDFVARVIILNGYFIGKPPKIATTLLLPPMKDCVTSAGPVMVPPADRREAEVGIECLRLNFYDDAIGHFQQIRDEASRTELVQLTQRMASEFDAGSRYWQIRLILGFYNRPSPTPPHTAFEEELMAHYASLDRLERTRAEMLPTLAETV